MKYYTLLLQNPLQTDAVHTIPVENPPLPQEHC